MIGSKTTSHAFINSPHNPTQQQLYFNTLSSIFLSHAFSFPSSCVLVNLWTFSCRRKIIISAAVVVEYNHHHRNQVPPNTKGSERARTNLFFLTIFLYFLLLLPRRSHTLFRLTKHSTVRLNGSVFFVKVYTYLQIKYLWYFLYTFLIN